MVGGPGRAPAAESPAPTAAQPAATLGGGQPFGGGGGFGRPPTAPGTAGRLSNLPPLFNHGAGAGGFGRPPPTAAALAVTLDQNPGLLNAPAQNGNSPFYEAVQRGDMETIELLHSRGAPANVLGKHRPMWKPSTTFGVASDNSVPSLTPSSPPPSFSMCVRWGR